jgi:AcrR family transcriptional regulator
MGKECRRVHDVVDGEGLRERKKADTRQALSAAAVRLCVERGYHRVTVADIADAVGVSRRTFSNYFPGKAECVTAFGEGVLDDMLDVIEAELVHGDLADVLNIVLGRYAERLDTGLDAFFLLMQGEEELRAAALAADVALIERVGDALAKLIGAPADDIRARAAAGSAALIARLVSDKWIATGRPGGRDGLTAELIDAFAVLDLAALQRRAPDDPVR